MRLFFAILAPGLLLSGAWLFPGTIYSSLLGISSCFIYTYLIKTAKNIYSTFFFSGVTTIAIAFYWLTYAISQFGGFNWFGTAVLYLLFVFGSSLQFLLFPFYYRNIWLPTERLSLRTPVAWVMCETFSLRIFPWQFGHTQIAFSSLVQIADVGGTLLVSFIMFWVCDSIVEFIRTRRFDYHIISLFVLLIILIYGVHKIDYLKNLETEKINISVVQGNISVEQKNDAKFLSTNVQRYLELSRQHSKSDNITIWPESVINDWIPDNIGSVAGTRFSKLQLDGPLISGALTFRSRNEMYNSAIAILSDGTVLAPYHKRVLMPYGEYTPLGNVFPWMRSLNSTAGDFSAGENVGVFNVSLGDEISPNIVRVSPLICYEDILPEMSREATLQGAELLVNITNDGWFGRSVEPYQHNLIASFRAIENRRYLIRATNSGFTTVINPLGETVQSLAPDSEGIILAKVGKMSYMTIYTKYIGQFPFWFLLIAELFYILSRFLIRKVSR